MIERLSGDDLMSLDGDHGTVPMQVGAILWFGPDAPGVDALVEHLAGRLPAVPRLRQVIRRTPLGCGRPIWVDDAGFRLAGHLSVAPVEDPQQVDRLALDLLAVRLPRNRPLWAGRIVTGPDGSVLALVLVVHHVLADGLAALALLGALADGADVPAPAFPRPVPSRRDLTMENLRGRVAGLRTLPMVARQLVMAVRLLVAGGAAPRTSLNRPTGTRRVVYSVSRELETVREAAHASGGTINDAALAVVSGAVRRLLAGRGEDVAELVISVPFAFHAPGGAEGNASAVMPLRLPATGELAARIRGVADVTAAAKRRPRAMTNALLRPGFALLVRAGLFHRFIDSQRTVNTLVTNVRGPVAPLVLAGRPVTRLVPLTSPTGNLTVAFVVLSYAGRLSITTIADPDACPDLDALAAALADDLDRLSRPL
nr:wax ester/triacylglycerol synthase domain-containing protein [Propionicimonas sp.]